MLKTHSIDVYLLLFCTFNVHEIHVGPADLERTLHCLTRGELSSEEIEIIVDRVMKESDLDQDHRLSYTEFEHVISRAPDFANVFHMRF